MQFSKAGAADLDEHNPAGLNFGHQPDPWLAGVQELDSSLLKRGHDSQAGIFARLAGLIFEVQHSVVAHSGEPSQIGLADFQ